MSIPDDQILNYFTLATEADTDKLNQVKQQLESDSINPMELKKELAFMLVEMYHNKTEAEKAQKDFGLRFSERKIEVTIATTIDISNDVNAQLIDAVMKTGIPKSKSDARRLIKGGGIKVNGEKIIEFDYKLDLSKENIITVGKKKRNFKIGRNK